LKRFTAEMEVCRELQHPNIVQAYDLIDLGDTVAFTMEYVRGVDLLDLFRQKEQLSFGEIDRIFLEILGALTQLHERDIVHRDIKLENILVREDGTVKLSDLGLMKRLDREGLTKPGLLLGTVHYMPPEYITSGQYDATGDVYGVAIMLLELTTKKRRLASLEGKEVIQELVRTRFEIPHTLLEELPRKYQQIIKRGTAVDKEKRYQSVHKMKEDFERDFSEFMAAGLHELPLTGAEAVHENLDLERAMTRMEHRMSPRHRAHQKLMIAVLVAFVAIVSLVLVSLIRSSA
ncbi:serine/threonine protein kinase, partial [bacterium]|nr:serine/threonine protein kinase [bacterium]